MSDAVIRCEQCGETAKMKGTPNVDKDKGVNVVIYECSNGHTTKIEQPLG